MPILNNFLPHANFSDATPKAPVRRPIDRINDELRAALSMLSLELPSSVDVLELDAFEGLRPKMKGRDSIDLRANRLTDAVFGGHVFRILADLTEVEWCATVRDPHGWFGPFRRS